MAARTAAPTTSETRIAANFRVSPTTPPYGRQISTLRDRFCSLIMSIDQVRPKGGQGPAHLCRKPTVAWLTNVRVGSEVRPRFAAIESPFLLRSRSLKPRRSTSQLGHKQTSGNAWRSPDEIKAALDCDKHLALMQRAVATCRRDANTHASLSAVSSAVPPNGRHSAWSREQESRITLPCYEESAVF
jgi:hypothetical protein